VVLVDQLSTAKRWSMLAIALTSTLFANVFINGAAFLIPTLHIRHGLNLAHAGLLSALPSLGMVVTLIAWGYVVDRVGERIVLAVGSALTAAAAFAAAAASSLQLIGAFLLLGGMAAASSNSASGRLVVGWFPPERRGLAMGIRQTAQPLGVGLGALVIPRVAEKPRRRRGAAVSRGGMRGVSGGQRDLGDRPAAPAPRTSSRGTPDQPVSGIAPAVADPRRFGAAGRAAGCRVDLHAGMAHR
jgi:MFS family permease